MDPGEGVANLAAIWSALSMAREGRELHMAVEGLDNRADVRDHVMIARR